MKAREVVRGTNLKDEMPDYFFSLVTGYLNIAVAEQNATVVEQKQNITSKLINYGCYGEPSELA